MISIRRWASTALIALSVLCGTENAVAQQTSQWPIHNDGFNKVVEWDHYSFIVKGKRAFMFVGEMHYWRIPVPELWQDILEKMKAGGLNSFAFYSSWAWHAPTPSTLDFTQGARDYSQLYRLANKIGLYVFIRPGPYVNAEASAGGFPTWLLNGAYGGGRNNDSRYTEAWTPYMTEFAKTTAPYQISRGGNGLAMQIENEYGHEWLDIMNKIPNPGAADYMNKLEQSVRDNGIDIPLYHNNAGLYSMSWSKDFAPGLIGDVDIYGVDNYPTCYTCDLSQCENAAKGLGLIYKPYLVRAYYDHFQEVAWTQPEFMPEFQGGSFNPWGGPRGGCLQNSNQDYANLFYRNNIGERVTAMSLYMYYGGTNWGWIPAPVTATSYDYSAAISEGRGLGPKYYETKNVALFTNIAADLAMTDRIGNGSQYSTNAAIYTVELRNPRTKGAFYVIRHSESTSPSSETLRMIVRTSAGNFTIPQKLPSMALNGWQSKIITTDFSFGIHALLYSTADILTYNIADGMATLVLWVPDGESGEFFLKGVSQCETAQPSVKTYLAPGGLIVTFTNQQGMTVLEIGPTLRILLIDRTTAYPFFSPSLSNDPLAGPEDAVLVHGPYLVRSASDLGETLTLTGDVVKASSIEVFASSKFTTLTWNGKELEATRTSYGSLIAQIAGPAAFPTPQLGEWKMHDSLPEIDQTYSDTGAAWKVADHMTTQIPTKSETLPILYFDEYGFHQGYGIWRGYFSSHATGVFLKVQGGTAFGWSAWLNGVHVGSWLGNSTQFSQLGTLTLSFANATLKYDGNNVLVVVQDNSGHDEQHGVLNARGIINATLLGGENPVFTKWTVAGTAGGEAKPLDLMRGVLNEGGLAAERLGWHLPGFDDSAWETSSPTTVGLSGPGIRFYRTTMPLLVPSGLDVSISFILSSPGSHKLRSLLFVNGYQYGRFNPWMGNQIDFPVPPGVLNYNGDNTIGLAVWAQSTEGAQVGVQAKVNYVAESSLDLSFDSTYLRPGWTPERLAYA